MKNLKILTTLILLFSITSIASALTEEEAYNLQMSQDYEESLELYEEEYLNDDDNDGSIHSEQMQEEMEEAERVIQEGIEDAERVIREDQEAYEEANANRDTSRTVYRLPTTATSVPDTSEEVSVGSIAELVDQEFINLLALILDDAEYSRAMLALESILDGGIDIGVRNTEIYVPRTTNTTTTASPSRITVNTPTDGDFTLGQLRQAMQLKVIDQLGYPIEGYTPRMFLAVFPGLRISDFDDVDAMIGKYVLNSNGTLGYDDEGADMLHSAAGAITLDGYQTVLDNVLDRAELESDPSLNDVIQFMLRHPDVDEVEEPTTTTTTTSRTTTGLVMEETVYRLLTQVQLLQQ